MNRDVKKLILNMSNEHEKLVFEYGKKEGRKQTLEEVLKEVRDAKCIDDDTDSQYLIFGDLEEWLEQKIKEVSK